MKAPGGRAYWRQAYMANQEPNVPSVPHVPFRRLLLTGAAGGPAHARPAASTDYLWLTRPV